MMTAESMLVKRPISRIIVALFFLLKLFLHHIVLDKLGNIAIVLDW